MKSEQKNQNSKEQELDKQLQRHSQFMQKFINNIKNKDYDKARLDLSFAMGELKTAEKLIDI